MNALRPTVSIVSRPALPLASAGTTTAPAARATVAKDELLSAASGAGAVRSSAAGASKGKVLILLPENGSDPTETAVPYAALKRAGYDVVFATASGRPSKVDTLSLRSPFLLATRPPPDAQRDYEAMLASPEFKRPITFDQALGRSDFAGLYVPGGEGKGMPAFLDNTKAHDVVRSFHDQGLPSAFLCHGGLMAARTTDPRTGKSIISGQKVTTLPKKAEQLGVAAFMASGRPRVYGAFGGNWAADEMARAAGPGNFVRPELQLRFRGEDDARNVVASGSQVFGGGPWDARPFAHAFVDLLDQRAAAAATR